MGGLISRYFLECLDGWRDTRTLVTFGTPYRGSLNALDTLVNGMKIKFFDLTEARTIAHGDLPAAADIPVLRRRRRRPRVRRRGRHPQPRPGEGHGGARLPPRDRAPPSRSIARTPRTSREATTSRGSSASSSRHNSRPCATATAIKLLRTIEGQDPGGDGTVPRPSATPLEYEDDQGATFSAERHASLQNDDHLLLQLAGVADGEHDQSGRCSATRFR